MRCVNTPDEPFELARIAGPRSRRAGRIAAIAGGAVVLIASTVAVTIAATRDPEAKPAAQQQTQAGSPTTAAGAAATTATSAAAVPTTPSRKLYKLGDKVPGDRSATTVHAYKQPVAKGAPKPEQEGAWEWGAVDVEVCPAIDATVARENWHLVYANNTVIEPSSVGYEQFPEPKYPWEDRDVLAGRCLRGWITFAVPAGTKPAMIEYTPATGPINWVVS